MECPNEICCAVDIECVCYQAELSAPLCAHVIPNSHLSFPSPPRNNEFARWCPAMRVQRLAGDAESRNAVVRDMMRPGQTASERGWNVLITTYEVAGEWGGGSGGSSGGDGVCLADTELRMRAFRRVVMLSFLLIHAPSPSAPLLFSPQ